MLSALSGYVIKGNRRDIQALLPAIDIFYRIIYTLLHLLIPLFPGYIVKGYGRDIQALPVAVDVLGCLIDADLHIYYPPYGKMSFSKRLAERAAPFSGSTNAADTAVSARTAQSAASGCARKRDRIHCGDRGSFTLIPHRILYRHNSCRHTVCRSADHHIIHVTYLLCADPTGPQDAIFATRIRISCKSLIALRHHHYIRNVIINQYFGCSFTVKEVCIFDR